MSGGGKVAKARCRITSCDRPTIYDAHQPHSTPPANTHTMLLCRLVLNFVKNIQNYLRIIIHKATATASKLIMVNLLLWFKNVNQRVIF